MSYCPQLGYPVVSIFDQAFNQGILTSDIGPETIPCFKDNGYVYSGFRHYPKFQLDTKDNSIIWLVRDPRDMAVSMYYSVAKSHRIPKDNHNMVRNRQRALETGIEQFVISHASNYLKQFNDYQSAFAGKKVHIYRYEDIIYEKLAWFKNVLEILDVETTKPFLKEVVSMFDVIPTSENQDEHIRQVHPGNYKKKLSQDTIAEMTELTKPFLDYFDYKL
jgi:hypothetical protein